MAEVADKKNNDIFRVAVLQAKAEAGQTRKNMKKIIEAMAEAGRSEAEYGICNQ